MIFWRKCDERSVFDDARIERFYCDVPIHDGKIHAKMNFIRDSGEYKYTVHKVTKNPSKYGQEEIFERLDHGCHKTLEITRILAESSIKFWVERL